MTIQIRVSSDPLTNQYSKGYDYYFHIAITNNDSNTRIVTLEALRPNTDPDIEEWFPTQAPILCSSNGKTWYLLPHVQTTEGHRDYRCPVTILPGKTMQVANNTPIIPEFVTTHLRSIAQENPELIQYHEIGHSVQGLPISLLEVNEYPQIERDRFLIWTGIHPSEPDPLAAFWVIEWLMSNDPEAVRARDAYTFEVLPMINPDGFHLGTSGCNANGVNIFWDFRRDDPIKCPESVALWRWIEARPPQVALDIHAYIYQVNKRARPYIGSIRSYPPKFRRAAWSMQRAVVKQCRGEAMAGNIAEIDTSLAPHLVARYGTLVLPGYHLHLADGPEMCRRLTIDTLAAVTAATMRYQPLRIITTSNRTKSIDLGGFIWHILELLFDRLPRRIRKRFRPRPKARPAIDTMPEWAEHRFDSQTAMPVATISPGQIS